MIARRGHFGLLGLLRRRPAKILAMTSVALSVVLSGLVIASAPAGAVGGYHIDTGPGTTQAVVRNGPATTYSSVGALNNGTPIDIA
jgi:uncharacterized protein YraI